MLGLRVGSVELPACSYQNVPTKTSKKIIYRAWGANTTRLHKEGKPKPFTITLDLMASVKGLPQGHKTYFLQALDEASFVLEVNWIATRRENAPRFFGCFSSIADLSGAAKRLFY